jgi:hypothetical protein
MGCFLSLLAHEPKAMRVRVLPDALWGSPADGAAMAAPASDAAPTPAINSRREKPLMLHPRYENVRKKKSGDPKAAAHAMCCLRTPCGQ